MSKIGQSERPESSVSREASSLPMPFGTISFVPALESIRVFDGSDADESLESTELLSAETGNMPAIAVAAPVTAPAVPSQPPDSNGSSAQRGTNGAPKPPPLPSGRTAALHASGSERVTNPSTGPVPRAIVPPRIVAPVPRQLMVPTPVAPPKPEVVDDVASFMADIVAAEKNGGHREDPIGRISDASWFSEIFDESYSSLRSENSDNRARRETRFVAESFGLVQGAAVLDVACGYGRHALLLAQLGYEVTGIDLSRQLLEEGLAEARRRGVSVKFAQGDMRQIPFAGAFDGISCLGTSFGYFDDYTNLEVLRSVARALRPGGRFVLEVVNRDYIASRTPRRHWWEAGATRLLEEVNFLAATSSLHVVRSLVRRGEAPWEQRIVVRLYSVHELSALLGMVGLAVVEVSGDIAYRGTYLGAGDRSIWITAQKSR